MNNIYNLSIGCQNIEGQHNSLIGCKLQSYVKLVNDIEILSETWSNCKKCKDLKIEGYNLLDLIEPIKTGTKKGRKSGGIHIYCKSFLKPFLNVVKRTKLYIWLEIDKNLFQGLSKNLKLCAFYSPPNTSQYFSDQIWDELEMDITSLTTD